MLQSWITTSWKCRSPLKFSSTTIFFPGEIEGQLSEQKDVQRNIRNMQNDMLKLNQLLTKEGKLQENLEQDNILMENDFILSLKVCSFMFLKLYSPHSIDMMAGRICEMQEKYQSQTCFCFLFIGKKKYAILVGFSEVLFSSLGERQHIEVLFWSLEFLVCPVKIKIFGGDFQSNFFPASSIQFFSLMFFSVSRLIRITLFN